MELCETRLDRALLLQFAARLKNIEAACARADRYLQQQGIRAERFDILLLLREMLNNAVIHGSCGNAEGIIRVKLQAEADELCMEIQDQGPGFDWKSRLAADEVDPAATSGRGLSIAKRYADTLTYNPQGNIVRLVKRVNAE